MKICLDARTATPHFPGIGRYISNLARTIPGELDVRDSLLLLHNQNSLLPGYEDIQKDAKIQRIPVAASAFSLSQQWEIPRLLRQAGASLYHSPYYLMPYRLNIPVVLTVYDLIPLHFPQYVSARARLLFRFTSSLATKVATRIIAISHTTQRDFIDTFKLPADKITPIPLAAAGHFHPQPTSAVDNVRKKHHLPEKFVLYLGTNKPHKNLFGLLEAWARMKAGSSSDKIQLVLAGPWDARYPRPWQRVKDLSIQDSVRFIGPVAEAELPALYCAAQLFVFPSLYEGFGLPVLEALACGTPVACSKISSLKEVAGEAAVFFDPCDPLEIVTAIQRLWSDEALREEMRQQGFAQAAKFSWQETAKQTSAVYSAATARTGTT